MSTGESESEFLQMARERFPGMGSELIRVHALRRGVEIQYEALLSSLPDRYDCPQCRATGMEWVRERSTGDEVTIQRPCGRCLSRSRREWFRALTGIERER